MNKTVIKKQGNQLSKISNLSGGVELSSIPKVERNFLPYSFMANDKTSLEGAKAWHFYIQGDGGLAEMTADWYLVHLCTRRATRKLIGSEYKNRHYQLLEGIENKNNKFEEISEEILELSEQEQKENNTKLGYVSLCAACKINKQGLIFTTIFTHESFGLGENYFIQCLQEAEIQKNSCVKIFIASHEKNIKVSRKGFSYLANWKFKQWNSEELTKEMRESTENAWTNQAEQISFWINN